MKVRNTLALSEAIDNALAWRKKELTSLRILIGTRSRDHEKTLLLRAAMPVLYAHWEGFAKEASQIYLDFVSQQGLYYSELNVNFTALTARGKIRQAADAQKISAYISVVDFIFTQQTERAKISSNSIDTESNLSSSVLKNIMLCLGLDYDSSWSSRELLVDGSLLKNRNEIAHGTKVQVDEDTYRQLHDLVIDMLNHFRNIIENAAELKSYLKSAPNLL